jgi:6-phosphogluconolactonase
MNPEVQIFDDLTSLSKVAAEIFVENARQAIEARGRFLVVLSGGNTPMSLYRLLVHQPVDWTHVHIFWGDERCVPVDDPGNSCGQARDALLRHVPIPQANVHRVRSELGPVSAAKEYELELQRFADPPLDWPRFDLVLLGMGDDGHTASLFPGSPVDVTEPVVAVTAHYQDRPANRVSLTPPVFNSARHIIFLVSGQSKSETLASVLKGGYHPLQLPAQRIQPTDGEVTWLVDAAAASKL